MDFSKAWLIFLPIVYVGYVIFGGVVFHHLERETEKVNTEKCLKSVEEFLENKTSCLNRTEFREVIKTVVDAYEQGLLNRYGERKEQNDESWAIHKSVYFATTVVSTIGYGNTAPATKWGRVFCVFFALIGIPLALVMYGKTGVFIDKMNAKLTGKLINDKDSRRAKVIRAGINIIGGVTLFIFLPPIWFAREEEWSYLEGVYYAFISLTTIGFGDYVAGFETYNRIYYHLCVSLWIILGLAWMSSLISNLYEIANHSVSVAVHKIHDGVHYYSRHRSHRDHSVKQESEEIEVEAGEYELMKENGQIGNGAKKTLNEPVGTRLAHPQKEIPSTKL